MRPSTGFSNHDLTIAKQKFGDSFKIHATRKSSPDSMLRRRFLLTSIITLAMAEWPASAASALAFATVIDAMPGFWRFWDTKADLSDDVRVPAFFKIVVAAYPDLSITA